MWYVRSKLSYISALVYIAGSVVWLGLVWEAPVTLAPGVKLLKGIPSFTRTHSELRTHLLEEQAQILGNYGWQVWSVCWLCMGEVWVQYKTKRQKKLKSTLRTTCVSPKQKNCWSYCISKHDIIIPLKSPKSCQAPPCPNLHQMENPKSLSKKELELFHLGISSSSKEILLGLHIYTSLLRTEWKCVLKIRFMG